MLFRNDLSVDKSKSASCPPMVLNASFLHPKWNSNKIMVILKALELGLEQENVMKAMYYGKA